jgi:hypothetical protein
MSSHAQIQPVCAVASGKGAHGAEKSKYKWQKIILFENTAYLPSRFSNSIIGQFIGLNLQTIVIALMSRFAK